MEDNGREYLSTLSELIRMLRGKAQLSQEELSEKADISSKTVNRIEAGIRVSDETLRNLGAALRKEFGEPVDLLSLEGVASLYQTLKRDLVCKSAPSELDVISARNLREAGQISDELGSFGLQDLYVTRDCEKEIVDAIREIGQPFFVTGPAGSGKTSTLWRIANRLIAENADIYFFRADFLVSDAGFEKVKGIPFSANAKSFVIVDTVDSVVGQLESRHRLEDLFQEFQRKGYCVVAAIRPAEKNQFFTDEKSIPIPGSYKEEEFLRVVESHVKVFYRLKDAHTIAGRVEEIKSIASGNTPVVELVYHPLTLRMLFSVYAPTEIPTEVNAISLYLVFWQKRVEADWRAGRPGPEPGSKNLSKAAAWIAEVMLVDGSLQVGRDQMNLAALKGNISQDDVAELATRGILHRIVTGQGHDGYEFFHQTFFEFAAAWAVVSGKSTASIEDLYLHLKENQFDSLRVPVIQNALALGKLVSEDQSSNAKEILVEILEQQPENLLYSALFAVSQQPTLDATTEKSLRMALRDRNSAALFVKMTPSTPVRRLPQLWGILEELYIAEQVAEPERNPRAVRVAIVNELPRTVSRAPALTDEVLTFITEQSVIETVTGEEISGIGIELRSLAALLFETSQQRPELSGELFLEGCRRLRARDQKHNLSFTSFIVTYCHSEHVPKQILTQAAKLIEGIDDAKVERVKSFLNARTWDESKGLPYRIENLPSPTNASHVQLIQNWSRGKPLVVWENLWSSFADLCAENVDNKLFTAIWVRELWEHLDKHPLESKVEPSHRAFEFLTDILANSLVSSNRVVQHAARKTCAYLRSQNILSEIYARIAANFDDLDAADELEEIFLPAMIREAEKFDAHLEPFKSALTKKSARKKVVENAAALIGERPQLWRGLTDFLVVQGEFHRLEVPLATGQVRAQPLSEHATELVKRYTEEGLRSVKAEDRQRTARIAHMALSWEMGLELDYSAMRKCFEVEQDPRTAAWIAMCNMEIALSRDEVASAYHTLLEICANGDLYVRDRATDALIRGILNKEVPFKLDEFLAAMRTNLNLRKLCAAAKLAGSLANIDRAAAKVIARFVLLDREVNVMGKTVLASVRIQARIPLMLWARSISEVELLELINHVPGLDAEVALLVADLSLHTHYKEKAAYALQGLVRADVLVPGCARSIANMVRSRMTNIQPLLLRSAA